MILNLDFNENESKEWHEYMRWLENDDLDQFRDVTKMVKEKLAELIYKVWKRQCTNEI